FFFSSRRRHTRFSRDWSSDVCSSDLGPAFGEAARAAFTDAMRAVAVLGAVLMLAAAWMAARLMRDGGDEGVAVAALDEAGARGQIGRASGRGRGERRGAGTRGAT